MSAASIIPKLEKDIADYNRCTAAAVTLSDAHVVEHGGQMLLRVTRSVEDIDNDKRRNYEYTIPIPATSGDTAAALFQLPPTEVNPNIQGSIRSQSGRVTAVIRADDVATKDSKTPPKQVLEVWASPPNDGSDSFGAPVTLTRKIVLPSDLHGKVVIDPTTFGRPSWSPDEKVLVYVAERKKPETTSFFDPKVLQDKDNAKIPGGQNTLGLGKSEGWGEQLSSLEPLFDLFLVDIETGRVAKVENVPGIEEETSMSGFTLGTPVFSPDGKSVVYAAWDSGSGGEMPKRLGLIYCFQRASKLYASSVGNLLEVISQPLIYPKETKDEKAPKEDTSFVCLTPSHRLARSPRFSPCNAEGESKLVFLASEKGFDTHFGHFALHALEWKDGNPGNEKILVKQRWNIRDETSSSPSEGIVEHIPFPGIALVGQLPEQSFITPDAMVLSTIWGSSFQIIRISLKDGTTKLVKARIEGRSFVDGLTTQEFLCTTPSGGIILKETAPNNPGVVACVPPKELFKTDVGENGASAVFITTLSPLSSSSCSPVPTRPESICGYSYQILTLERQDDEKEWNAPIQCVLMLPDTEEGDPKPPLILLPHGGPHSVSTVDYMPTWSFLCGQSGYALLLVNYRGSIGFGQDAVENLPSRISDLDVKDVVHAVKHVAESGLVDPERLGICGGSHGGFVTGHCIGQYPDLFKAACMRNPVTNIASMITSTDIPDWCIVEGCGLGEYNWQQFTGPSADQLKEMYEKSPIAHSQHVRTPTLVALGMKDLRVPPSQGLEYYHILRSNGVTSKLLMYDDCDHPIGAIQSKADHWLNIKHWFDEHLQ